MKKLLIAILLLPQLVVGIAYSEHSEPIIDSELILASKGMIADWQFQLKQTKTSLIKGTLIHDEKTSQPSWSAQGCVNDFCFMDSGGPKSQVDENSTITCKLRLFVPSDTEYDNQAQLKLRLTDETIKNVIGTGVLYIKTMEPMRANFVAGEKPILVKRIELQDCVQSKILSEKTVTSSVAPSIIGGSMMIPFRILGEVIGAEVGWNPSTNEASYTIGPKRVVLRKGINKARVIFPNFEKTIQMTVAPANIKGSTMVPLRFVSTILGGKVEWDSYTNTAVVSFPNCE